MPSDRAAELELFRPGRTALVVIDVQNDYCAKGGHFERMGRAGDTTEEAVDNIVALLPAARAAGIPIIFTRNVYDPPFLSPAILERRRIRGQKQDFCQEGTWGVDFYRVAPEPGDLVVTKHRYGAFTGTNFATILRSRQVDSLVLCGVKTNVCVETTAREGYTLDYNVLVLSDCTATDSELLQEATLENMRRHFGFVATSEQMADSWRAVVHAPA